MDRCDGSGFPGWIFTVQSLLFGRTLVGFVAGGRKSKREAGTLPLSS